MQIHLTKRGRFWNQVFVFVVIEWRQYYTLLLCMRSTILSCATLSLFRNYDLMINRRTNQSGKVRAGTQRETFFERTRKLEFNIFLEIFTSRSIRKTFNPIWSKNKTWAPIGAWKRTFPSFQEIMTNWQTDKSTNRQTVWPGHRVVTLPLNKFGGQIILWTNLLCCTICKWWTIHGNYRGYLMEAHYI